MVKISANLGFLWQDLPLADAIYEAKQYGFDAVECHFPYDQDMDAVKTALSDTELPMIGLNTATGDKQGDSGLCALPDRIQDAQNSITQAIAYAHIMGSKNIHMMAGIAPQNPHTERTFIDNLHYASKKASPHGITLLIEPLNAFDKAGYFLNNTLQAQDILHKVQRDNVKILFDCYHVQRTEGNVWHRYQHISPLVGHIQIASSPQRAEPNTGELNYTYLLQQFKQHGYTGYIGAEYIPSGATADTLGWLPAYQAI